MSHHLDTAAARQDPRLNISDVYLFKGTTGTVFVMNIDPLSGTGGFNPEALYEFKIDTNGDAVEDITLRAVFTPQDASGGQQFTLSRLTGSAATDRNATGQVLVTGQLGQDVNGPAGLRIWAGKAGEPFYIEGAVVTAVRASVTTGTPLNLSGYNPATATNLFGHSDVTSIVLELPHSYTGDGLIGFWGATALSDHHGGWVQINRTATPLIDTLFDFTAGGTVDYNAFDPSVGDAMFGPQAQADVAAAVVANQTVPPGLADTYGRYVRGILFPDMLRYEVGTSAYFGALWRNGRGLTEPSPEAMFQIVLNKPVPMGLDSSDATGTLRPDFPYLAPPL